MFLWASPDLITSPTLARAQILNRHSKRFRSQQKFKICKGDFWSESSTRRSFDGTPILSTQSAPCLPCLSDEVNVMLDYSLTFGLSLLEFIVGPNIRGFFRPIIVFPEIWVLNTGLGCANFANLQTFGLTQNLSRKGTNKINDNENGGSEHWQYWFSILFIHTYLHKNIFVLWSEKIWYSSKWIRVKVEILWAGIEYHYYMILHTVIITIYILCYDIQSFHNSHNSSLVS